MKGMSLLLLAVLLLGCGGDGGSSPSPGNIAPVANAGPDQNATTGSVITLDGSGCTDAEGDLLTHRWTMESKPAGSFAALSNPAAVRPTFTADRDGVYVVSLVVNDGQVDSAPDTVTITASTTNSAPVANAGPDQNVTTGSVVTLDGGGSTDADADSLTYAWSLTSKPAGSAAALSSSAAVKPTFTADLDGAYVLSLVVNDGTVDSAADTVTITASTTNSAPVANAGPDRNVLIGTLVALDGSGSSDADGNPLTYAWSFVSRPAGSSAQLSNPAAVGPTFTADVAGSYVLSLIVSDGSLQSQPDTVTIVATAAGRLNLPRNGQVISYAAGDDGALQMGVPWPSPRFVDHGDGTVTDNLTGLMWLKDANCMRTWYGSFDNDGTAGDGGVTWQHALDFVRGMNDGSYPACAAGRGDWRLPNAKELRSLIDYSRFWPSLPAGHPFINLTSVWGSSSYADDPSFATVMWYSGAVNGIGKNGLGPAWPVRTGHTGAPAPVARTGQTICYDSSGVSIDCAGTGQDGEHQAGVAWPEPRFSVGTGAEASCVTDHLTGLVWTRSPESSARTWSAALIFATSFTLCGHDDWRVPNVNELESLWNLEAPYLPLWLESQGFTNVVADDYWSSTTDAYSSSLAWGVGIWRGGVGGMPKGWAGGGGVWLVRGGR